MTPCLVKGSPTVHWCMVPSLLITCCWSSFAAQNWLLLQRAHFLRKLSNWFATIIWRTPPAFAETWSSVLHVNTMSAGYQYQGRARGGGVLQGGGRIIKIFNFLQWPRWPSTAWRGSTSQHRPASDHLSLDLLFGLKLANGRIRATATNINELNSNRNPTINGLMYWVDGTGWRI